MLINRNSGLCTCHNNGIIATLNSQLDICLNCICFKNDSLKIRYTTFIVKSVIGAKIDTFSTFCFRYASSSNVWLEKSKFLHIKKYIITFLERAPNQVLMFVSLFIMNFFEILSAFEYLFCNSFLRCGHNIYQKRDTTLSNDLRLLYWEEIKKNRAYER